AATPVSMAVAARTDWRAGRSGASVANASAGDSASASSTCFMWYQFREKKNPCSRTRQGPTEKAHFKCILSNRCLIAAAAEGFRREVRDLGLDHELHRLLLVGQAGQQIAARLQVVLHFSGEILRWRVVELDRFDFMHTPQFATTVIGVGVGDLPAVLIEIEG